MHSLNLKFLLDTLLLELIDLRQKIDVLLPLVLILLFFKLHLFLELRDLPQLLILLARLFSFLSICFLEMVNFLLSIHFPIKLHLIQLRLHILYLLLIIYSILFQFFIFYPNKTHTSWPLQSTWPWNLSSIRSPPISKKTRLFMTKL